MFVVKRKSDGAYKASGYGWVTDMQKAKAWPTKNGPSSHLYSGGYNAQRQYVRTQIADLVEVHLVVGPDPNAPAPPPAPPKKKGKGKIEAQAREQASSNVVPDWWKDVAGDQVDTDIPA